MSAALADYSFYSGHIRWPKLVSIPHRFVFTILRDPVSQVISQYHYLKSFRRDYLEKKKELNWAIPLKDSAFSTYLRMPEYRAENENLQTRYFLDAEDIHPNGEIADAEAAIAKAIHRAASIDIMGIYECFELSAAMIARGLGATTPPVIGRVNVTSENHVASDAFEKIEQRITEEDVEMIRAKNKLDAQLYAYAQSRFLRNINDFAPAFASAIFASAKAPGRDHLA